MLRATRFILVFSLLVAIFRIAGSVEIDPEERDRELKSLQQRIRAVKQGLDELAGKKHALLVELKNNEESYGKLSNGLKTLQQDVSAQEERLASVQKEREENQKKTLGVREALVRQMRAVYATGRQERLQLILNQKDPAMLSRMLTYFDYLNNARVKEFATFQSVATKLRNNEQELRKAGENLALLHTQREDELRSLKESRAQRAVLLAKLEKDYRHRKSELQQLEEDERELEILIESLKTVIEEVPFEAPPSPPESGIAARFAWPVDGELLQDYGSKTASGRSNGVLIRAREGEPVRAVAEGRVVYADWLVHYGLLVIVDHGAGYMTLYAFNQALFKAVGERARPGEIIASAGRSGGRSQAALYFEVRKNGKPVNPRKWWGDTRSANAN